MDRFPGNINVYPSADSVELTEDSSAEQPQIYSPEFLRSLKIPDLPPGELKLKVGVPIILLRNLNPSEGLCNGTRLIIRGLQSKVIDAEIMTGSNIGRLRIAFSMTINKSQGQTLNRVGLYLPQPVFSYGQLYVALSRVTSYQYIKVLTGENNGCQTKNVVYNEVFSNRFT
ncbi:unnamed protein product [Rhizophagus irregularis]|nr:unnamed protein product [Rhizophagus irregularis]